MANLTGRIVARLRRVESAQAMTEYALLLALVALAALAAIAAVGDEISRTFTTLARQLARGA